MIRFRLFSAITKNDAIFVTYDIFLYHTGIIKDSVREALIRMENEIIEKGKPGFPSGFSRRMQRSRSVVRKTAVLTVTLVLSSARC